MDEHRGMRVLPPGHDWQWDTDWTEWYCAKCGSEADDRAKAGPCI